MKQKGFTLIELLIVMAIIGILASTLVIAVNPSRQFSKARDTQRQTDLYTIVSAVTQYASEHTGALPDTDGNPDTDSFPTTLICIGQDPSCFDLGAAGDDDTIVPGYLPSMPTDPKIGNDDNTGYQIYLNSDGRLFASASAETQDSITVTR